MDLRSRKNIIIQAPCRKWEMTKAKKQRLIDQPEFHPALDSRVPQFKFSDGTSPATPRKTDAEFNSERPAAIFTVFFDRPKRLPENYVSILTR